MKECRLCEWYTEKTEIMWGERKERAPFCPLNDVQNIGDRH